MVDERAYERPAPRLWLTLPLLALLAAFAAVTALRDPTPIGAGVDPSWVLAAEYASKHGLGFARDFVFSYGPYAVLSTRAFQPDTFAWVLAFDVLLAVLLVAPALAARSLWGGAAVLLCLLALRPEGDAAKLTALFGLFLLMLQARGRWIAGAVVLLVAVSPLLQSKMSFLIAFLPLAILADLAVLTRGGRLPPYVATLLLSTAAFFVLAGESLADLPRFLLNSLDVAGGYAGAMQIVGGWRELAYWTGGAVLALALAAYLSIRARNSVYRSGRSLDDLAAWLGLAWIAFMLFKVGFVRQDAHVFASAQGLPMVAAMALAFLYRGRSDAPGGRRIAIVGLGVVLAVNLAVVSARTDLADGPVFQRTVRQALTNAASVPAQVSQGVQWLSGDRWANAARMDADARGALKRSFPPVVQGRVDVMTWNLAPVIVSGLAYAPRPTIQNYAAYTPRLQSMDAAHFAGPKAPDTLFLKIEDIEDRLPSLTLGSAFAVIGAHYDIAGSDPLGLVLRKRPTPRPQRFSPLGTASVELGRWVAVPASSGGPVSARIDVPRTVAGRAMGFLLREPLTHIDLRLQSGRVATYRFVPGMARTGFILSPIPSDWSSGAAVLLDPQWAKAAGDRVVAFRITGGHLANAAFGRGAATFEEMVTPPGFAGDSAPPDRFLLDLARSDPSGRAALAADGLFAHAPTELRAAVDAPGLLTGGLAFRDGPDVRERTDGVRFVLTWTPPSGAERRLLDRTLIPRTDPAGLEPVSFQVEVPGPGTLSLRTEPAGGPDYDWSIWRDLRFKPR